MTIFAMVPSFQRRVSSLRLENVPLSRRGGGGGGGGINYTLSVVLCKKGGMNKVKSRRVGTKRLNQPLYLKTETRKVRDYPATTHFFYLLINFNWYVRSLQFSASSFFIFFFFSSQLIS